MIRALIMGISLLAATAGAATLTAEQFESDYSSLSSEIFINEGEVADGENFVMLVLIRLDFEEGTSYVRQPIAGNQYSFRLGPYSYKPTGAFFNEMLSVLSDYELKEK